MTEGGPVRRLGASYRRDVGPEHVGRRVTVRRWIVDPARGTVASDVVGHLLTWEDGVLTVQRRNGEEVEVAAADILASRVIPDTPPRPGRPSLPS